MKQLKLDAISNQSLSITLDNVFYDISIKEANGVMAAKIVRDNREIASYMRLLAGVPLLPFKYQEKGNFILLTDGEMLPFYDQFGVTQFLVYASQAELNAIYATTA